MNIKILLSSDNAPIIPALQALRRALPSSPVALYCLCSESELEQTLCECENIKKENALNEYRLFTFDDFASVPALANHLFLNPDCKGYLMFLSSDVLLEPLCLQKMREALAADARIAGVNPQLLASWVRDSEKRIAFMGLAFDYQKRLHYLYEGILAKNRLVQKTRFFQLGLPGCLLIRSEDFANAGGFKTDPGFLAFPGLALGILNIRAKGYACIPDANGSLQYRFDSWSFCGAWNSILQRGRLETGRIKADYASFCEADNLQYGCDSWLNEGPEQIPDLADVPDVRAWQNWSYRPRPASLLAYLALLPDEEKGLGVELARNRPASLPQTLQYYRAQAESIEGQLGERGLSGVRWLENWQRRIRRFHYGELKPGIELLKKAGIYNCSLDLCPAVFDAWVEIKESFESFEVSREWPEIGVIMPVWNPKPDFLKQAIESVVRQTYPNWQLCIADDASTKKEIRPMLERFAKEHERIRVKFREINGHICRASNTALEMLAAPYAAFLDHDDLLSPHALCEVARRIAEKPDLGFIYSDDDRINERNVRRNPMFKPDYDCDLFYTWHLSVYASRFIREVGGLRIGTEGAQDQDLRFRVTELLDNGRIAHIPSILYHWRVHEESTAGSVLAKPYVLESGPSAYLEAARRRGRIARWEEKRGRKPIRLLYYPQKRCLCTIVFLVDRKLPSQRLIETACQLQEYADLEMFIQPLRADSPGSSSLATLTFSGKGFARACDGSLAKLNGDILVFLSADLEPWDNIGLEQLVEMASLPHIAMAGGNIWHKEKLVNGGWYPNLDGLPFALLEGMDKNLVAKSAWSQLLLPRHVIGVPWQCMALKKVSCQGDKFLDEKYGSFATVDFALRAMSQNKFVAMNPWVNLQIDKWPEKPAEAEMELLQARWGEAIATNGLRNPNLRASLDNDWTLVL